MAHTLAFDAPYWIRKLENHKFTKKKNSFIRSAERKQVYFYFELNFGILQNYRLHIDQTGYIEISFVLIQLRFD